MYRYQIRLPESMCLEDLVGDLAMKAWLMINSNFDYTKSPLSRYPDFLKQVASVLSNHIKAFDLCGASNVCTDAVESRPWSSDPELSLNPGDCICHLISNNDVDEFLGELALKSLESIKKILRPHTEIKVLSTLQVVFRCVLGDYLYFNPQCGEADVCQVSDEISAWGRNRNKIVH